MKVAALTDHENTPSSRFRIRQHIKALQSKNIEIVDFPRKYSTQSAGNYIQNLRIRNSLRKAFLASGFETLNLYHTLGRVLKTHNFDATWISREVVIGYPSFEFLLSKPIFYDIDDAIFLNPLSKPGVKQILKRSTAVFAGNAFLADYCKQYASNVHIIPTAVDTDIFFPKATNSERQILNIGWSGTSSSYIFFKPIERELAAFFKSTPNTRLYFFSDRPPNNLNLLAPYINFRPWNRESEADQIRELDLGLMPIDNSEWSKGKCSYKLLLYSACGIPTICSPFGMNNDLMTMGKIGLAARTGAEWRDALEFFLMHKNELGALFPDTRRVVENNFSARIIRAKLAKLFNSSACERVDLGVTNK